MRRAGPLAAMALLVAGMAAAQPVARAPLSAGLSLADPVSGAALAEVTPGQPFRLQLDIRAEVGSVPADLAPLGWIRQRGPNDLSCAETAAAYRAAGRAALGSVDLNGIVLGVVARDGAFTVLDPLRALGSANLLSAHRFDPPPAGLAADPRSGRFLLSLPGAAPGTGRAVALDPYGHERVLARGLHRPGPIVVAASGGGWLLDQGAVLRLGRGEARRLAIPARAIAGDAGTQGTQGTQRLAVLTDTELLVLDDSGTTLLRQPAPGARALAVGPEAALWLDGQALHVVWLDAPEAAQTIALPGRFDRLALEPQGRMVFLFARARTGFAVADLALGRVVQGAATDSPVAELGFLPGTAVLRLADQSGVGVMDLRQIAPGREAVVGHVALGPPQPPGDGDAALLAPYLPEPVMLAVHAASYSGFVIDRRHAISGKPPMEALRLRGGIPQQVRALDRGLRPLGGGRFATTTRLPGPGDWQLVISAGIGQMAFCAAIPTPPAPVTASARPGTIRAERDARGSIRLRFLAGDGQPAPGLAGTLELAALIGNWRGQRGFATDTAGLSAQSYDLAPHLPLVITARDAGFAPLVLEEAP